jgi:leader peptidase (prepilin peptidase) / N-methyltransferase
VGESLGAGLVAAVAGAAAGMVGRPILRRLPPPAAEPDSDEGPSPYAPLADDPRTTVALVVISAIACGIAGASVGWHAALPMWVVLGAVGSLAGYIDARTRYLPTAILAPAYVVVLVLLVGGALAGHQPDRLLRALLGWMVFGGFYLLMWLVYPRGIGYGDIRLAGLLGAPLGFAGWGATITALYAGIILAAVVGTLLVMTRIVPDRRYPFGPFMLVGALFGLAWGRHVGGWYTSL